MDKLFWGTINLLLGFVVIPGAFAGVIETEAKVTSAIIYIDSAQVTRCARVNVKEGFNEILFTNVPEYLNEGTLTVSAQGSADARMLDAKIKQIFLEEAPSEQVRQLVEQIEQLKDSIAELNNLQRVIGQEQEFLTSIKLFAQQQVPEDLITKMPDVQQLGALSSFIRTQWQDTFQRRMKNEQDLREKNKTLEKLNKELAQLEQMRRKEKQLLSVELDVQKAGDLEVSAGYLIDQAGWYPEYDARVNYETQQVELVCMGVVKQTSGEDWQDVQLTLSTAKPTISGRMPQLTSWNLRPRPPMEMQKCEMSLANRASAPSWGGAVDDYLDKEKKALPLYAQVAEKFTSVNYRIARSSDVKSDGTRHRLPVFSEKFPVKFQYSVTPKLSPFAYLTAKVTNQREQLLPANARLFLDDVYVGSSSIDAVGKGEEFDFYLGIDEGVKVKREKIKEQVKEIWIAGLKRNNKVINTTFKVTLENYKSQDIKINLFDQLPVSQSDRIAVKSLEMTPKPTEENYKDRKGVMRWELDIAPREKKEVNWTYQIEHPRDMDLE
ncbi:MAG: mucoidy inhibitor MuiA family protein [Candidatus Omnitrophota bacterium]